MIKLLYIYYLNLYKKKIVVMYFIRTRKPKPKNDPQKGFRSGTNNCLIEYF